MCILKGDDMHCLIAVLRSLRRQRRPLGSGLSGTASVVQPCQVWWPARPGCCHACFAVHCRSDTEGETDRQINKQTDWDQRQSVCVCVSECIWYYCILFYFIHSIVLVQVLGSRGHVAFSCLSIQVVFECDVPCSCHIYLLYFVWELGCYVSSRCHAPVFNYQSACFPRCVRVTGWEHVAAVPSRLGRTHRCARAALIKVQLCLHLSLSHRKWACVRYIYWPDVHGIMRLCLHCMCNKYIALVTK